MTRSRVIWLLALAVGMLLVPLPRLTAVDNELGDLLHAPCFAILAAMCYVGWRGRLASHPVVAGLVVCLMLSLVGLVSEWLQGFSTRTPSWRDVTANVTGAAAGILWLQRYEARSPAVRRSLLAAALALIVIASAKPTLALYEHLQQWRSAPSLASFERPRELQHWSGNACQLRRTSNHASDGAWSLRIDMFPARWPGAGFRPVQDWSGYKELVFDVWLAKQADRNTPTDTTLALAVKVTDAAHNGQPHDRFQKTVRLSAGGKQSVRIPLAELQAAPAEREINLSRISYVQFFIVRPTQRRTIWLDNIHLQ